jgi:Na+-driven multidrug efflux pump
VFISGVVEANHSTQGFLWYFSLPAVFCTVTNVLMNLVSAAQLSARGGVYGDDGGNRKATVWFILMLALSFCCVGGAVWVLAEHYPTGSVAGPWPGIALLLNTAFVTISGLLFFFGRPKGSYGSL